MAIPRGRAFGCAVEAFMSRRERERDREREGRESHSKRLHSRFDREHRFDREPSPKKSRRDGKPATEKIHSSNNNLDIVGSGDQELKQHRRLKDALPFDDPPAPATKVEPDIAEREPDKKIDGASDGNKDSSDPTGIPRSKFYFQHDDRGSTGHGGRGFNRKATDHGRWTDRKEHMSERTRGTMVTNDLQRNDEKTQSRLDEKKLWRHDRFYDLEVEAPPARKRPAFREKKVAAESETVALDGRGELTRLPHNDHLASDKARREDRGGRGPDKSERPFTRDDERYAKRGDGAYYREQRPGYQQRERYGAGGLKGREGFNGRYAEKGANRPGGFHPEKWKHDLFDEANRSPSPKNEEEQIAKIEALLAL